jgi:hypothetical protein
LQQQLAAGNLTYAERLAILQRLLAVQKARESMQVRFTREELMASEMDASRMIGMTGSGRAMPQIRGRGAGVPSTADSLKALEGDAAEIRARTATMIDTTRVALFEQLTELSAQMAVALRDVLVDSLANGIAAAVSSGSIGEGFKALGQTMLAGLGDMLIAFGRQVIVTAGLFEALRAKLVGAITNPGALAAVGVAMVALGAGLKGAAGRIFGGQQGGSGNGSMALGGGLGGLGVGGMQGGSMRFGSTTAGGAGASVSAAQPMQVTIIGPNDAGAQRAIATLMDNASRRGLVQGAGMRTF